MIFFDLGIFNVRKDLNQRKSSIFEEYFYSYGS
jgi:hypothetical protein